MCMDGVPSTCLAAASSRRRTWCVCTAPTLGLVGQRLFLFKGASGLCFFSLPVACRGFFLCGCPGRSWQENGYTGRVREGLQKWRLDFFTIQQQRWFAVLDGLGDDVGEIALDAQVGHQPTVDQALVLVNVARHDLDDIVDTAASGVALSDFGTVLHGIFKTQEGFAVMLLEADLNHHRGPFEQNLGVQLGTVAADDTGLFQALDPLPAGADRQIDGFGQAAQLKNPAEYPAGKRGDYFSNSVISCSRALSMSPASGPASCTSFSRIGWLASRKAACSSSVKRTSWISGLACLIFSRRSSLYLAWVSKMYGPNSSTVSSMSLRWPAGRPCYQDSLDSTATVNC